MKTLLKFSVALLLLVSFSACNKSIPVPEIGQSKSSLEESWSEVKKIDKQSIPGFWILKKYRVIVEFDEADNVKLFANCSGGTENYTLLADGEVFAKKSNLKVLYKDGEQYLYHIKKLSSSWIIGIGEGDAQAIAKAFEEGSDDYDKPLSVIKNEEAYNKIRIKWWEVLWEIL